MVVIRLSRGGSKKRPFYQIVVADSRFSRDGRFIEKVGFFNPMARGQDVRLNINDERLQHWISQGAQMSSRVENLYKNRSEDSVA
jgi:small subunit ribosomal protein S16